MWGTQCVVAIGLSISIFGASCGAIVRVFSGGDSSECAADGCGDTGSGLKPVVNLSGCGDAEGSDSKADNSGDRVDDLPEIPGGVGDSPVEVELSWVDVGDV